MFEKQKYISITKSSQIHKEKFNIHTGHIGGSSQSEWIGEYTVLEGGRWEMIKPSVIKQGKTKNQNKTTWRYKKTGCTSQTNPVNGW